MTTPIPVLTKELPGDLGDYDVLFEREGVTYLLPKKQPDDEDTLGLSRVWVPPYVRMNEHGHLEHVDGYWREAGDLLDVDFPKGEERRPEGALTFDRMYHLSPTTNRYGITTEGLKVSQDQGEGYTAPGVYFSPSPTDDPYEDLYEVDTRGLAVFPDDPVQMAEWEREGGSFYVAEDIPPSRVRLIRRGTGHDLPTEDLPKGASAEPDLPKGDRPGYGVWDETRSDDENMASVNAARVIQDEWDRGMYRALALGQVSSADAHARGLPLDELSGHPERVEPLPEVMYHATGALREVLAGGLKTRDELSSTGLGGGSSNTVSFTTDRAIADRIAETLIEAHYAVVGDISLEDLSARADAGGFGDKFRGEAGWDRYIRRVRSSRSGLPVTAEKFGEKEGGTWVPDGPPLVGRDGVSRYFDFVRPQTPEEEAETRFEMYKRFLAFQEDAGGPMNPLFFLADVPSLAAIDPANVGVVEARPRLGAVGYRAMELSEWRTWTGDAVTVSRVVPDDLPKGMDLVPEEDGRAFAAGGAFPGPLYRASSPEAAESIRDEGYQLGKRSSGLGEKWGSGVYLVFTPEQAAFWSRRGAGTERLTMYTRVKRPFTFSDYDSDDGIREAFDDAVAEDMGYAHAYVDERDAILARSRVLVAEHGSVQAAFRALGYDSLLVATKMRDGSEYRSMLVVFDPADVVVTDVSTVIPGELTPSDSYVVPAPDLPKGAEEAWVLEGWVAGAMDDVHERMERAIVEEGVSAPELHRGLHSRGRSTEEFAAQLQKAAETGEPITLPASSFSQDLGVATSFASVVRSLQEAPDENIFTRGGIVLTVRPGAKALDVREAATRYARGTFDWQQEWVTAGTFRVEEAGYNENGVFHATLVQVSPEMDARLFEAPVPKGRGRDDIPKGADAERWVRFEGKEKGYEVPRGPSDANWERARGQTNGLVWGRGLDYGAYARRGTTARDAIDAAFNFNAAWNDGDGNYPYTRIQKVARGEVHRETRTETYEVISGRGHEEGVSEVSVWVDADGKVLDDYDQDTLDEAADRMAVLDKLFENPERATRAPVVVYKGISAKLVEDLGSGDIIGDRGFASVGLDPQTGVSVMAGDLYDQVGMEIYIPEGTPLIISQDNDYLQSFDLYGSPSRYPEAVLPRGTRFRIIDEYTDPADFPRAEDDSNLKFKSYLRVVAIPPMRVRLDDLRQHEAEKAKAAKTKAREKVKKEKAKKLVALKKAREGVQSILSAPDDELYDRIYESDLGYLFDSSLDDAFEEAYGHASDGDYRGARTKLRKVLRGLDDLPKAADEDLPKGAEEVPEEVGDGLRGTKYGDPEFIYPDGSPDSPVPVPLDRGPGPVMSVAEAQEFARDSVVPGQWFHGGSGRSGLGARIWPYGRGMDMMGRGYYLTDDPVSAETWSTASAKGPRTGVVREVYVNLDKVMEMYSPAYQALINGPEVTALRLEHPTMDSMTAVQIVAQRQGYQGFWKPHLSNPGKRYLLVFDASRIAMVRHDDDEDLPKGAEEAPDVDPLSLPHGDPREALKRGLPDRYFREDPLGMVEYAIAVQRLLGRERAPLHIWWGKGKNNERGEGKPRLVVVDGDIYYERFSAYGDSRSDLEERFPWYRDWDEQGKAGITEDRYGYDFERTLQKHGMEPPREERIREALRKLLHWEGQDELLALPGTPPQWEDHEGAMKVRKYGSVEGKEWFPITDLPPGSDVRSLVTPQGRRLRSSPTFVEAWDRKFLGPLQVYAQDDGMTQQELLDLLTEHSREWMSERRVCVATSVHSLVRILGDGRMKTQYESRTSRGDYTPGKRKKAESELFGYPLKGVKSRERPVYGYMGDGDAADGSVGQYGSARVILKDSVRSKTTVTRDDSLGREEVPEPVDDTSWRSIVFPRYYASDGYISGRDFSADEVNRERPYETTKPLPKGQYEPWESVEPGDHARYVEAQIHGGVSVDDIAEVVFYVVPNDWEKWLEDALKEMREQWKDQEAGRKYVEKTLVQRKADWEADHKARQVAQANLDALGIPWREIVSKKAELDAEYIRTLEGDDERKGRGVESLALTELARIWVPPYVRMRDGKKQDVSGYWREVGLETSDEPPVPRISRPFKNLDKLKASGVTGEAPKVTEEWDDVIEEIRSQGVGNCYEAGVTLMMSNASQGLGLRNARLVQGSVVGTSGYVAGIRFAHTWVEADGETIWKDGKEVGTFRYAVDFASGHSTIMPVGLYYHLGNIGDVHEYTLDEMHHKLAETMNYGPWSQDLLDLEDAREEMMDRD